MSDQRRSRLAGIRMALVSLALIGGLTTIPSAAAASVGWSSTLPTTGDVTVPAGVTVVLDTDLNLDGLTIEGRVLCGDRSVRIRARWILVKGVFRCGRPAERFTKRLTITLKGSSSADFGGRGDKYLVVVGGGRLELHGKVRRSWTTLAETAASGATTIRLADPAWRPGDRLVVAPTNYTLHQTEEVTVAARDGDVLTLAEPLEYEHFCGKERFRGATLVECAEVGLLTRNITIQGGPLSELSGQGGHAMFMAGSSVHLDG